MWQKPESATNEGISTDIVVMICPEGGVEHDGIYLGAVVRQGKKLRFRTKGE